MTFLPLLINFIESNSLLFLFIVLNENKLLSFEIILEFDSLILFGVFIIKLKVYFFFNEIYFK